jgi:hypothetical protein
MELLSAFASTIQKHLGNDQSKFRGVTFSSSSLEALLSQSSALCYLKVVLYELSEIIDQS